MFLQKQKCRIRKQRLKDIESRDFTLCRYPNAFTACITAVQIGIKQNDKNFKS